MTWRGRTLALLGLVGTCLGVIRGQYLFSLVSFTILIWIVAEWLRFNLTLLYRLPRITIARRVGEYSSQHSQETSPNIGTLYVGRKVPIEIAFSSPRKLRINMLLRDYLPELVELLPANDHPSSATIAQRDPTAKVGASKVTSSTSGSSTSGSSTSGSSNRRGRLTSGWRLFQSLHQLSLLDIVERLLQLLLNWDRPAPMTHELFIENGQSTIIHRYRLLTRAAGRLKLPGLRMTLEDRYGFFRVHRFHDLPQEFRVLPAYYESGEFQPQVKRHNSLPRHGIHRLQRAGMGSELLELREYEVGDPPKSIAWKVSARRDKLLTRQYESEVPVRVHLIVDGSNPTRLGGYGLRLLDQMNYVAASVAKAALAVGDPVDCSLISESGVKRLPWFNGDRGFLELLKHLSNFSLQAPPTTTLLTPAMLMSASAACLERYPELFDRRFSRIPFAFSGARRNRWRLVNVVSEIYRLSPKEQVQCMLSDQVLAGYLQLLLHDMGLPWMSPIVPTPDEPQRTVARRMQAVSDCMLRSIMHAHDNEVFVILMDLISCGPSFYELERTVKLAIAKHHRVAFVCPTTTFERPRNDAIIAESEEVADLVWAAERTRVRDLSLELKRDLLRLGAAVSFSGEQNAIRLVLAEMDTARSGRRQQSGALR